ncbi:MAG: PD-(D/E)XK nuclease family protein [Clostridia bacterium]|nr:PD-(D/E)XK nuclease family protein [Clostridia bacterium]
MPQVQIVGARAGQLLPYILPQVKECHARGGRVILLVPEQYTLQAERELVEGLALPGLMDIDVLSPRRLTRRIREAGGHNGLAALDDRGRSMAIAQALTLCQEELVYYRRVALTPGLPDKLSVLIADLQRAGLTPEAIREHADSMPSGALKAKETDIALIWAAYLSVIEGRFADETMQQREIVRRLASSGVMDGVTLFVYGFDVLPQPMCELLTEAAAICEGVTVTMTMDARDAADGRIFLTQRRSAADLMEQLQARGVPVQWRYLPLRDDDGRHAALTHLERHLFTRKEAVFKGDSSVIAVHAAANPYAEAAYIAQQLRAWHEDGTAWQHMAVAMADASAMPGILSVTLAAAGIPFFAARKDSALRHGLCRMLLGALRSATGGYASADVLHMAKSGFSPLTAEEAHRLENYAIENGVNRGKWTKPFTRGDAAESTEALRQRLIAPVESLRERLRSAKSATQSMEAVFLLLEDVGAYQKLLAREEELLRRGMAAEAAQNRQVWQIIMDLLDQLYALLGEHRAAMKDVARFVEAGLTGAAISSLPPQPDAVMLGEAGHLLTGRTDALVLCGMQDGVLGSGMDSLITESERRTLSDAMRRAIGLTRQETAALRQSDFYRTLALPRERLLVTFSQGGQDGAALRPSGLIDDMKAMFPELTITGGVTADGSDDAPLSPQMALDGLALRLRAMADGELGGLEPQWLQALQWLWQNPDWHERMRQVIASLSARVGGEKLPPEQTRRIFTQDVVSISRLEKFAACPYQHYVDYGLKPVKRERFAFEASDAGDFYHAALQGYAGAAMQHPSWPDLPEEEVDRLMDGVLAPLTQAWSDGPLSETPAQRLQGEKYVRTVRRAAWLFTRHAVSSRFTTVGEEVVFGEEGGLPPVVLTLKDGRRIALRGKIDRIDRWKGDKGVYLRVIDYKSSRRDIDPTRLWYGLQLQLMLYLQAASQGMNGEPAGAFYFTVRDPLVDAEDVKEAAEKAIAKQLRLEGVVLADVEVVDAMDTEGGFSLGTIFTSKGNLYAHAPAYTPGEMQALLAHTQEVAAMLADGIREGDVSVSPAETSQWSACQWCEYAAICGIDPSLPGCTKRVLPHLNRQELLGMLAKENSKRE